jgi:phospholipase C
MSDKPGLSRRDALRAAMSAAAAAACDPKSSVEGDSGEPGGPGSIEHVIFIMMENRSHDHFLGARKLVEGRDEDGLTADMSNPMPDGTPVAPYATSEPCIYDPPHSWSSSHRQFNEGANDGFVTEYAARSAEAEDGGAGVMAYLSREDVPFTNAWADAYCLCDAWFSSLMCGTWPNRLYSHSGTSVGKTNNSLPDDSTFFEQPTIWQKLDEQGVSWRYYYSDLPFIAVFKDHSDEDRTVTIERFFTDVENGELAQVVQVEPAFGYNDNHPPHHPGLGELFLASIYEAIAASQYWDKCLIVVTYDEHGGFFDHVPPPKVDDDLADDGFDQLGFRVPSLLIGPWVKQGVDSTVYDHTSYLKYLCEKHGIEPWTTRIAQANSIGGAIDTDRMQRGEPLPAITLPVFDFEPENVGPECLYYNGPPAHLQLLAEHLQQTGLEIRLDDLQKTRGPWLAAWAKQGLIG